MGPEGDEFLDDFKDVQFFDVTPENKNQFEEQLQKPSKDSDPLSFLDSMKKMLVRLGEKFGHIRKSSAEPPVGPTNQEVFQFQCMTADDQPILEDGRPVMVAEPGLCHQYFLATMDPGMLLNKPSIDSTLQMNIQNMDTSKPAVKTPSPDTPKVKTTKPESVPRQHQTKSPSKNKPDSQIHPKKDNEQIKQVYETKKKEEVVKNAKEPIKKINDDDKQKSKESIKELKHQDDSDEQKTRSSMKKMKVNGDEQKQKKSTKEKKKIENYDDQKLKEAFTKRKHDDDDDDDKKNKYEKRRNTDKSDEDEDDNVKASKNNRQHKVKNFKNGKTEKIHKTAENRTGPPPKIFVNAAKKAFKSKALNFKPFIVSS